MKKIACIVLASILLLLGAGLASHLIVLNSRDVYFGVGTYASATDLAADGESEGKSELSVTVMAITVGREGKILKCKVDSVGATVKYSSTGAVFADATYPTKRELGDAYGMSTNPYASDENGDGVILEWFEQAAAFESVVVGKHIDEIDALLAEGGRGSEEIIAAGCTIAVSDFIRAFDAARKNLKLTEASIEDEIALGIYTSSSALKDATASESGSAEINAAVFGATVSADGRVTAAMSDSVGYAASFDKTGKPMGDSSADITLKREKGDGYGMSLADKTQAWNDLNKDGVILEWFEQADAFDGKVVGLTKAELPSLVLDNGYGGEALVASGCTINVGDFVKSANKALAD